MVRGVRRPEEIAGLGLSHRLTARIGALLKKNTALSLAVLESARPGTALENVLLAPLVLERGRELDAGIFEKLAGEAPGTQLPSLTAADADDGFRVICLQDEIDAGDGWGAAPPVSTAAVEPGGSLVKISQPENLRGGGESVFSRSEIERWRLKLATASAATERIEVMRALALAPLNPAEKLEALLQGLSDRDSVVRTEAAALLPQIGVDRDIADSLAGINHANSDRRMSAMERLRKLVSEQTRDVDVGCVAACVIASLKYEFDPALTGPMLDLLAAGAPALGRNAARVAEVLRMMAGLIATASKHGPSSRQVENVLGPSHRLLRALGKITPEALSAALLAEHERCADPVTEAFLLQPLLELVPAGAPGEDALIKKAAAYLSRDIDEGRDSRAIGTRMIRRGEKALLAICEVFPQSTGGAQKYIFLLMDEMCRGGSISPEGFETAAAVVLSAIATGNKGLRMAAMQCRFVSDARLSEATRGQMTGAFLNSMDDFAFPLDIENAEMTLARMGLPALDPLIQRFGSERTPAERARAARLLGELALSMKVPPGQLARVQKAIDSVLRRLEALNIDEDFGDRGELLRALGKLASSPAASREADAIVLRTLLDAAASDKLAISAPAIEGLTYAASSRRAPPEVIAEATDLLRRTLEEMVLDVTTKSKVVRDETVIEITGDERYTTLLPVVLTGIGRLAKSTSCPSSIINEMATMLLERWKLIATGTLVWGPASTMQLVEALKTLGCQKSLSAALRMEIIKALLPKHVQTPIMHAISEILASADTEATGLAAVTIGQAMLGRRGSDGKFQPEDREDILKATARIAGRKVLSAGADAPARSLAFRKIVVEELFKALKDSLPNMYEQLAKLRENMNVPLEVRIDIEKRLKEYQQLDVRR